MRTKTRSTDPSAPSRNNASAPNEMPKDVGMSLLTYLNDVNTSAFSVPADETEWTAVYRAAEDLKFQMVAAGFGASSRVLYSEPDGTVVVDTGKGASNTWENYELKQINENHNTRPAIMFAQLSIGGVGAEKKNSTSVATVQEYAAARVGLHFDNQGTLRISRNVTDNGSHGH